MKKLMCQICENEDIAVVQNLDKGKNRYFCNVCRSRGLTAYCGTLEEVPLPKALYNWIIVRDVIEHVTDPLGFLKRINDHLTSGGIASVYGSDIISYLREPEVVLAQRPDEHPFILDYSLLARLINQHLNIMKLERFKIFEEDPNGYRVLITASKPEKVKNPKPWIPEEVPQKHY